MKARWNFGSPDVVQNVPCDLGPPSGKVKPYAKNVAILFNPDLKFDNLVNAVVKLSFYHLV